MTTNRYILATLPEDPVNQQLVALSQKLCGPHQAYTLGINSVPHNTLIQFEAEDSEIESLWEKFKNLPAIPGIEANCFQSSRVLKNGDIYFDLIITRTPELQALHLAAMESAAGKTFNNRNGLAYRPHYTLGFLHPEQQLQVDLQTATIHLPPHASRLGLGLAGPHWRFEKVLYIKE